MSRYNPQEKKGVSKIFIIALLILGFIAAWFFFNDQGENAVDVRKIDLPKETLSDNVTSTKETIHEITENKADNQPQQTQVEESSDQFNQIEDNSKKELILPSLANSDAAFTSELIPVSADLLKWFSGKNIIQKYIVLINGISQGQILYKHRRFLKTPGKFIVAEDPQGLYLPEQSYKRYNVLANAIDAINVEKGVQFYLTFRPLFEQVYKQFSYSDEYTLEDIFLKSAANVIGAPVIEGRIDLVQHSVRYKFADKKLESLTHIDKQMLRMGPENTRMIQRKLRKLAQAITVLSE